MTPGGYQRPPERPGARQASPLETVELGRTGLTVTRLGFGSSSMGGLYAPISAGEARATAKRAWELGIRLFDTAPHYGAGLAERRLGDALAERPRAEYVISTKVGRRLVADASAPDAAEGFFGTPRVRRSWDFTLEGVERSLDESLERLALARADVVLLHDPEQHMRQALEQGWPALAALREARATTAVGVGSGDVAALERFVREADLDCILLAGRLTLLDASAANTLLPACRERGVAVICAGVFNSGILADPRCTGARFEYVAASPAIRARAVAIAETCERWDIPIAAAAIRYPLLHPTTTAVLVGARSAGEIEADVELVNLAIPDGLWSELADEGLLPAC